MNKYRKKMCRSKLHKQKKRLAVLWRAAGFWLEARAGGGKKEQQKLRDRPLLTHLGRKKREKKKEGLDRGGQAMKDN